MIITNSYEHFKNGGLLAIPGMLIVLLTRGLWFLFGVTSISGGVFITFYPAIIFILGITIGWEILQAYTHIKNLPTYVPRVCCYFKTKGLDALIDIIVGTIGGLIFLVAFYYLFLGLEGIGLIIGIAIDIFCNSVL